MYLECTVAVGGLGDAAAPSSCRGSSASGVKPAAARFLQTIGPARHGRARGGMEALQVTLEVQPHSNAPTGCSGMMLEHRDDWGLQS